MNICVYGAASSLIDKSYIEEGKKLGRKIVERGHGLVFGGGSHGMMGAVADGAFEKSGYILGVIPEFFSEAGAEISCDNCTKYIYTETMRERKRELEENSNAFIVTPGGIGTLDEFFEILTLKQLGRHNKAIAIYNINGFYDELDVMMDQSIKKEFITDDCKELYKVFNDVEEMLNYIENYDEKDVDLNKVKIR
ncbi:MAG: TIGR00730 family Rossman fold protein [Clostridia bacterium]|nr:TIGR00730 family Rossman fold protein [Clostridia bacterium]